MFVTLKSNMQSSLFVHVEQKNTELQKQTKIFALFGSRATILKQERYKQDQVQKSVKLILHNKQIIKKQSKHFTIEFLRYAVGHCGRGPPWDGTGNCKGDNNVFSPQVFFHFLIKTYYSDKKKTVKNGYNTAFSIVTRLILERLTYCYNVLFWAPWGGRVGVGWAGTCNRS